jgi:hypothetical protein
MKAKLTACAVSVFLFGITLTKAQLIDHTAVGQVSGYSQATMDAIGDLRFFFAHASVGENMLSGLTALHNESSMFYRLVRSFEDAFPPNTTTPGTVYEYNRGNPTWGEKITWFEQYVANGWQMPKVDAVLNKFCYIDSDVDFATYRDSMLALEGAHPDTRFVYMTIPLEKYSESNIMRNEFNDTLRTWVRANGKILFDIADIEAHNTSGVESTFTVGDKVYQRLCDDYSLDGSHLNDLGSRQVALGFYALGADLVAVPEPNSSVIAAAACAAAVSVSLMRRNRRSEQS